MWELLFFKNHAQNEAGRLVPDLFLSFKKALCEVKAIGQNLSFDMLLQTLTWTNKKNILYLTSDCYSILIF